MADKTTKTLNGLLRGELAAVETYDLAIDTFDGEPVPELRKIKDEHQESANALRQQIQEFGGQPDEGSGVRGYLAKVVESAATVIGNKAALKTLLGGEESRVRGYEKALKEAELPPACKNFIQNELLPKTRTHVDKLDRLRSMI